ncbi:hypothetical protein [Undibacterium aquatile]|uniref:hypothetical protein n=1 Tax=Undibacterium aquatile TaxID=1537398 RepID=UPI00363B3B46
MAGRCDGGNVFAGDRWICDLVVCAGICFFRSVVPALLSGGAGTTAGSSIVCSCTIRASRIPTKERIWLSV